MLRFIGRVLPGWRPDPGHVQVMQCAAIPLLRCAGGELLVALLTSRQTKRWIVPKGWSKSGIAMHEMALIEAREEAGLIGSIDPAAIGSYIYKKRLHAFSSMWCKVDVYALHVTAQLVTWPEQASRRIEWLAPEKAALLVDEPDLAELIRSFA